MQALIDGMSANWQRERAESQVTLGGMIDALQSMPDTVQIGGLGDLDSYRGYYSDLAFEPISGGKPAKEVLEICRAAMGKVFQGYKGGDFVMGALTPLWLADWGSCGEKIIAIHKDGTIETAEDA